jgi:proteasome beta subunit
MDADLKKHMLKTGTTTLGIVTTEGIILAADKKVTYGDQGGGIHYNAGEMSKIIEFNENLILTIAGTATYALRAISAVKAQIKIKALRDKKKVSIKEIANLFSLMALQSLQSGIGIGFILAGKEDNKTILYQVSVDGIVKKIDTYKIDGSGMMHVNAILDTEYNKNISLKEGIELAKKCIIGSSGRDPASGIGYEIWTITSQEIKKVEDKTWKLD